jgi:iron complex transport system substrate-binding protein
MAMTTRRTAMAGLAASGLAGAAVAAPRRVVSLVSCLDPVLVQVADPSQIVALSHYSRWRNAPMSQRAARAFPVTYGSMEEIVSLRPDVVLASFHAPAGMAAALERLGIANEVFAVPNSIAESLAQVRRVAALAGHPDRGERLAARIEGAIAAAAPPAGARPVKALLFQPNGFTTGPGTMMDELMRRCGLSNIVTRYGLRRSGTLPLELILADPPELLLAAKSQPGAQTWAERAATHPALSKLAGRMRHVILPENYIYCGGPVLIEAASALARARNEALA